MITGRRAFSGDDEDVHAGGDPDERAGTTEPGGPRAVARSREDDRPLSPKESRATLAVDGGPEGGARGPAGRIRVARLGASAAVPMPARRRITAPWRPRLAIVAIGALIVRRVVASDSDRSRRRPAAVSDTAHVRRRLDGLSSHLTRREDPGVRLRPQRRRQPRHLGPADSRRRSGQADPPRRRRCRAVVLRRRKQDRLSVQPARRRHLCHPDAGRRRATSRGARLFAALFPDGKWIAYGVTEQAGGRIYVAPAAGGPATPHRRGLLSRPGARLVARRPLPVVLGTAPARRPAGGQHRLVRGGGPRRVARRRPTRAAFCCEKDSRRFRTAVP